MRHAALEQNVGLDPDEATDRVERLANHEAGIQQEQGM